MSPDEIPRARELYIEPKQHTTQELRALDRRAFH